MSTQHAHYVLLLLVLVVNSNQFKFYGDTHSYSSHPFLCALVTIYMAILPLIMVLLSTYTYTDGEQRLRCIDTKHTRIVDGGASRTAVGDGMIGPMFVQPLPCYCDVCGVSS